MQYCIETTGPVMFASGGKELNTDTVEKVSEERFWNEMKKLHHQVDEKKQTIVRHLQKADTFIQLGKYRFFITQ